MFRLALLLHSVLGPTVAGTFVVVALVAGEGRLWPLLGAATLGFCLALPLSVFVARRMMGGGPE